MWLSSADDCFENFEEQPGTLCSNEAIAKFNPELLLFMVLESRYKKDADLQTNTLLHLVKIMYITLI